MQNIIIQYVMCSVYKKLYISEEFSV